MSKTRNSNKGMRLQRSIKTVDELKARCDVNEFTDCWNYRGSQFDGTPHIWVQLDNGKCSQVKGGRAAYIIANGHEPAPGLQVYRYKCHNKMCVNPEHCKAMTKAQIGALIAKEGVHKGSPKYLVSNRIKALKRALVAPDLVRDIRGSSDSVSECSRRTGVAHQTVSAIRKGQTYLDAALNSSVFNWRPA